MNHKSTFFGVIYTPKIYDNTVEDAFIPEKWANEGLALLEENMVASQLVHRDFDNVISDVGDTVNAARPSSFTSVRKGVNDDITIQAVTASTTPVVLNQHLHTSFMLRDKELSLSFDDLVTLHIAPAMQSLASQVDQIILGQAYQFFSNASGRLGNLSSTTSIAAVADLRTKMSINKVPEQGRNLILSPYAENSFIKTADFTNAQVIADGGQAMREAYLGRKFGFNFFTCQNAAYAQEATIPYTEGTTTVAAAVGATIVYCDIATAPTVGAFIRFAGDDVPRQVVAATAGTTGTTHVTVEIATALTGAVLINAVVRWYKVAAVDLTGGYDAGYVKYILAKSLTSTVLPQVGQMVAFGTTTRHIYSIIGVTYLTATTAQIVLDRPLDYALVDSQAMFFGPGGSYNLAFERGAIALVNRPMALPVSGKSFVVSHKGIAIRVAINYDWTKQGTVCTFDTLCGVKVLDVRRGAVMLG